ncbi:MAG TPA: hypothetical protein DHV60_03135 [Verrucomicrobiales bacterium]|nr:hypothetical protein [Verrucomicrobiales bacterium]
MKISMLVSLMTAFSMMIGNAGELVEVHQDHTLDHITFGSCLKNPSGGAIMDQVAKLQPDLFVWLGDNIYVDTNDRTERFDKLYTKLGNNPYFKKLQSTCPNLAIWDDHDYGNNNRDRSYPLKSEAKKAFAKFWQIPGSSPIWKRDGIYRAHEYGPADKRVQIILLDGRWNLDKQNTTEKDSYLGAEQWAWLEKILMRPAKVRVICSGVQVVKINTMHNGWEMWGRHPVERTRLFELITRHKINGVVFISGDMHVAEIFCTTKTAYPFYDVTASGMDIAHPHSGKFLTKNADFKPVGPPLLDKNFGGIQIEWGANPNLTLELRNSEGKRFHSHSVPLSALQFKP